MTTPCFSFHAASPVCCRANGMDECNRNRKWHTCKGTIFSFPLLGATYRENNWASLYHYLITRLRLQNKHCQKWLSVCALLSVLASVIPTPNTHSLFCFLGLHTQILQRFHLSNKPFNIRLLAFGIVFSPVKYCRIYRVDKKRFVNLVKQEAGTFRQKS